MVRCTLARYKKPFNVVELGVFGDASGCGIAAAVYDFIYQDSWKRYSMVNFIKQ